MTRSELGLFILAFRDFLPLDWLEWVFFVFRELVNRLIVSNLWRLGRIEWVGVYHQRLSLRWRRPLWIDSILPIGLTIVGKGILLLHPLGERLILLFLLMLLPFFLL